MYIYTCMHIYIYIYILYAQERSMSRTGRCMVSRLRLGVSRAVSCCLLQVSFHVYRSHLNLPVPGIFSYIGLCYQSIFRELYVDKRPDEGKLYKEFICTEQFAENSRVRSIEPLSYGFLVPAESINLQIFFSKTTCDFWKLARLLYQFLSEESINFFLEIFSFSSASKAAMW